MLERNVEMCGVERALITCGVNFVNTPEDVQSRELIVRYHLETFPWPTNQPLQFTLCTEAYPTMKLAVLLSTSERNAPHRLQQQQLLFSS